MIIETIALKETLKFNYLEHSCTDGIEYQVVAVAIATEKQN